MKKTNQEKFWMSKFGDDYIKRNLHHEEAIKRNFAKILLKNNIEINSCLEFGSNVGVNLDALKVLYSNLDTFGVEINAKAYEVLKKNHDGFNGSVYEYKNKKRYDLTLSSGVLIHQNPKKLKSFYDQLYVNSKKYILICEYFNPKPVKVTYRGNENKLFKRDFAKELLNNYPKLKVIDYGFVWSNDKYAWGDDYNWFLFSK